VNHDPFQFQAISKIDPFPGRAHEPAADTMAAAEASYNGRFSPDEPTAIHRHTATRRRND